MQSSIESPAETRPEPRFLRFFFCGAQDAGDEKSTKNLTQALIVLAGVFAYTRAFPTMSSRFLPPASLAVLILAALFLEVSCASHSEPEVKPPDDGSYWNGEGMEGEPSIKINVTEQKAYFYLGSELAGESPISSGREGMGTRPGKFVVTEKDEDHTSSWFGDYVDEAGEPVKKDIDVRKDPKPKGAIFDAAKMPYFMRFNKAIGMHEGYLPGYPASHGCVRLPGHMAEAFFNASEVGTPVEVVR